MWYQKLLPWERFIFDTTIELNSCFVFYIGSLQISNRWLQRCSWISRCQAERTGNISDIKSLAYLQVSENVEVWALIDTLCIWVTSYDGQESLNCLSFGWGGCIFSTLKVEKYILLTKHEDRSGRISARGLESTDRAQRGPYKKDQGLIFSQDGPAQAWLIRDLLYDWNCLEEKPKW